MFLTCSEKPNKVFTMLKPHSHSNGFYWGTNAHESSPQPTASRSPSCSLTAATGLSNQAKGKAYYLMLGKIIEGWLRLFPLLLQSPDRQFLQSWRRRRCFEFLRRRIQTFDRRWRHDKRRSRPSRSNRVAMSERFKALKISKTFWGLSGMHGLTWHWSTRVFSFQKGHSRPLFLYFHLFKCSCSI